MTHNTRDVEQHQIGSDDKCRMMCANRGKKVGGARHRTHQCGAYSVKDKPQQKQRSDQPRIRHTGTRSIVWNAAVIVGIGASGAWHGDVAARTNDGWHGWIVSP